MTAGIRSPAVPALRASRRLATGRIVAFVGADGCGKSTVTSEITTWISTNVDALRLYFGSGNGTISATRRLLERIARVVKAARAPRRPGTTPRVPFRRGAGKSVIRDWGDLLWVLALTRERRARFRQAIRARRLGMVVICDRFPQAQFPGLNDGPCLGHWLEHRSWIRRVVARDERAAFRLAERHAPDLVVKLHVPLATALARRPEVPREQLAQKLQEITALAYPGAARTVDIDAGQPLAQVLADVKRAVWACL